MIQTLSKQWRQLDLTVEQGIDLLSTLCAQKVSIFQTIPQPCDEVKTLLDALDITMPVDSAEGVVSTRKKLPDRVKHEIQMLISVISTYSSVPKAAGRQRRLPSSARVFRHDHSRSTLRPRGEHEREESGRSSSIELSRKVSLLSSPECGMTSCAKSSTPSSAGKSMNQSMKCVTPSSIPSSGPRSHPVFR